MKSRYSETKTAAITLLEVVIVIAVITAIVFLLVAVPVSKPRNVPPGILTQACAHSLKNLGQLAQGFADDHNGLFPPQVSTTNGGSMELTINGHPVADFKTLSKNDPDDQWWFDCPADKPNNQVVSNRPMLNGRIVSYFFSVDATRTYPNDILVGDRDLLVNGQDVKPGVYALSTNMSVSWSGQIHHNSSGIACGNILFADGHVETVVSNVDSAIARQSRATNRVTIP